MAHLSFTKAAHDSPDGLPRSSDAVKFLTDSMRWCGKVSGSTGAQEGHGGPGCAGAVRSFVFSNAHENLQNSILDPIEARRVARKDGFPEL
jgi:hypothetical protein